MSEALHPSPLPIRWGEGDKLQGPVTANRSERGVKFAHKMGCSEPLTPALSPSDEEREITPLHSSALRSACLSLRCWLRWATMRLLDRYLLRELLVPLLYCLCGFWILLVFGDLFASLADFQKKKLLLGDIVEYYLVSTPELLVQVVPIALLLALLYALTNHSRHHEIVAIRAAGISLWRLTLPYLGMGLVLSIALFALNELWVPQNAEQKERILGRRIPRRDVAGRRGNLPASGVANLREGRTWLAGDYNPKTSEMTNPQIIWTLPDGSQRWLFAARAVRTNGVWTFFDASECRSGAEPGSMLVPSLQTNVLAMPEFKETPEQILSEIRISKGLSFGVKNKPEIPISQIVDYLHFHPHPPDSVKPRLYTELHGRLATPWTCLVVVLIAIPFGVASGRRNVFVGVAGGIFICLVYVVLQRFSLALGTGAKVAPWLAAWFPNIAFGITGVWLTSRVR